MWDKSVGVGDIRTLIADVDAGMADFIDPVTRDRTRAVDARFMNHTLSVDKVFTENVHGIGFGGIPGAEMLRRLFDRPDDLRVIADRWGEDVLCRESHATSLAADEAAVRRVLLSWGLSTKADLAELSEERTDALSVALKAAIRKN